MLPVGLSMCLQCAMTATVAVGSASGLRVWLRLRAGAWLTPGRLKGITFALLATAVIVSSVNLGGSS